MRNMKLDVGDFVVVIVVFDWFLSRDAMGKAAVSLCAPSQNIKGNPVSKGVKYMGWGNFVISS